MAEQDAFDSTTGAGVDQAGDYTRNSQSVLGQTTRGKFERGEWWLKTGLVGQRREIHAEASDDEAYRAESWSAQLGVRRQWGSTEALLGVDGQREWQASPGVNERVAIAGGFGLLRQRMGRFTGELGARAENHQRYGGFSAGEATLTYRPRQELKLHGKAARGYKTPSLYQLYAPDTSGPLGNPDLTPESNVSSELGAEWVGAGVIGVVAFQQDFQDLIAFSVAEGYQNRGTLRVQGLESYVISPEHSWGQVTLTWTQLDFSHYSQTPLRRPPYLVTTGWIGKKGDWTLELNLRAVGGRKDAGDSGTTHLVAYETLGGILGWNYNSQQEWSLRVNNMTDRQYEDVCGYGVAPLSAMLQWTGRH